eukprot:11784401-Prorocentrum_lima.AAC.1
MGDPSFGGSGAAAATTGEDPDKTQGGVAPGAEEPEEYNPTPIGPPVPRGPADVVYRVDHFDE